MSEPYEYDVYISYASADRAKVERLASRLAADGVKVWFDVRTIRPGDDIPRAINDGLAKSRCLVLALSKAAVESEWVTLETGAVLFQDPANRERRLIPLLLEDCTLPVSLQRLRCINWRSESEDAYRELIDACMPSSLDYVIRATLALQTGVREIASNVAALLHEHHLLAAVVKGLVDKIDVVERLTVLPNFEIPSVADLRTLDDLPADGLEGKRVLVKLDLDVPLSGPEGLPTYHPKFGRALLTLQELAKRGSTTIAIIGQGLSGVEYLETVPLTDTAHHAAELGELLGDSARITHIDDVHALPETLRDAARGAIIVLPNLFRICSEEVYEQKALSAAGRGQGAHGVSASLVHQLQPHYDIFVLDDFRSTYRRLPSNVGFAANKPCVVGRGLETDVRNLEILVLKCIELGKQSSNERVCLSGSSRPNDAAIVTRLLEAKLFDRVLLGPLPSLIVHAASGRALNRAIMEDLMLLASSNGERLIDVIEGAGKRILRDFRDRVLLPVDYAVMVDGEIANVSIDELERLDTRPAAIGLKTVETYCDIVSHAALVFHFGMLGTVTPPLRSHTERVIDAYANGQAVAFTAGDHITGLAELLGLQDKIAYFITGAKTTSHFLTGKSLPGLDPFVKA